MNGRLGRFLVGLPAYAWLAVFFLIPFLIVLKISLSEPAAGIPPYLPLWERDEAGGLQFHLALGNYLGLFGDELYAYAYLNSIRIAGIATLGCLLMAIPPPMPSRGLPPRGGNRCCCWWRCRSGPRF